VREINNNNEKKFVLQTKKQKKETVEVEAIFFFGWEFLYTIMMIKREERELITRKK
jgi:hypothetical protein